MSTRGAFQPVLLVPIKPIAEAKSRLREAFSDAAREELVRAMLTDLLTAVRGTYAGSVYLVTPDEAYDQLASEFDTGRLPDFGTDYNGAVAGALSAAVVHEAGAAVVLPGDLPRATAAEVATALEALREAEVVLVAAHDGGTGLLGLRPPDAIAPAFGVGSARAHLEAAAYARRRVVVLNCPSLARDVDVVADLLHDPGTFGAETRAFLARHPLVPSGRAAHGPR